MPGGMLRLGIPALPPPERGRRRDIANVTGDRRGDRDRHAGGRSRGARSERLRRRSAWRRARTSPRVCASPARSWTGVVDGASSSSAPSSSARPRTCAASAWSSSAAATSPSTRRARARRLGADVRRQVSLESCDEMPAHDCEVEEAARRGRRRCTTPGASPASPATAACRASRSSACTCVFDAERPLRPEYDESQRDELACDVVIVAAGMGAGHRARSPELATNGNRHDQGGPADAADRRAVRVRRRRRRHGPVDDHQRRRPGAARRLHDRPLSPGRGARRRATFDERPPRRRQGGRAGQAAGTHSRRDPLGAGRRRAAAAPTDFAEIEPPLTEEEARAGAARCLDCGVCSECHACVDVCPADAIDLDMRRRGGRRRRSARCRLAPASSCSRPTPSRSTATAGTRT